MRTSLHEALAIEQYIFNKQAPENRLVTEAKMIIDPELQSKVTAQQQVYQLVNQFGRTELKKELDSIYNKLMHQPQHRSFAQRIMRLFSR